MKDKDIRFVCHIDILGMRSLVNKDMDEAWSLLSGLIQAREHYTRCTVTNKVSGSTSTLRETIHSVTFSDTIVLFSLGSSDDDLVSMITSTTEIFIQAMKLCVPIRCAIAKDEFYFNPELSMYAGPALIQAYDIGESSQWLGICLDDASGKQAIESSTFNISRKEIIKWQVPYKEKTVEHYVINWPIVVSDFPHYTFPIETIALYEGFSKTFGPFNKLPIDVQAKYDNTTKFLNYNLS